MHIPEILTSAGREELTKAGAEIARLQRKSEGEKGLTGTDRATLAKH